VKSGFSQNCATSGTYLKSGWESGSPASISLQYPRSAIGAGWGLGTGTHLRNPLCDLGVHMTAMAGLQAQVVQKSAGASDRSHLGGRIAKIATRAAKHRNRDFRSPKAGSMVRESSFGLVGSPALSETGVIIHNRSGYAEPPLTNHSKLLLVISYRSTRLTNISSRQC
jgi:hypothetical protein